MLKFSKKNFEKVLYEEIIKLNIYLPADVKKKLKEAYHKETHTLARKVLKRILENIEIAEQEKLPLCQDTGMIWTYIENPYNYPISFNLEETLTKIVEKSYKDGFFRKSIVKEPVYKRENTKTNTPIVFYLKETNTNEIKVYLLAKGFGSENTCKVALLNPTEGEEGIIKFVIKAIKEAGGSPCPPIIAGIGIGGTMDYAAFLSKKALFRNLEDINRNTDYAELEKKLLKKINATGIGAGGLGGDITCLGVKIEHFPTHIAGLPVALSINCWADRKAIISFKL